jgi:acetylornithine deacetylase
MTQTPRSLDWTRRLVGIDTTSRNSNLGLIEEARDHLAGLGFEIALTRDASGAKANLFATWPDRSGRLKGGVVLSGHTDVVPVDGQAWSSDPFKPEMRDGRLYGRGACDMKGFIGACLELAGRLPSGGLARPLHLALSYDEEVGCLGAPGMIAEMRARGLDPEGCIVGEPTSMAPVTAHKGFNVYRCTVRGCPAHSSLPQKGVSAIEYAARLILFIRDLSNGFRERGPFDDAFDTPWTTASVGKIEGGTAANIVPEFCRFVFEFRNLPGVSPDGIYGAIERYAQQSLVPEMHAVSPKAGIEFEQLVGSPGLEADEAAEITRLVRRLAREDKVRKVGYGTEAGLFQEAGVPTLVCGPGDIQVAHRADEFVSLEQLAACEAFLDGVIEALQRDGPLG